MRSELSRWEPEVRGLIRVVAGALFVMHGTMKIVGYPPSASPMPPFDPTTQMGIAAIIETVGGCAMVLGLFTRFVAFIMSGEMAVAYFQVHFPQSPFPTSNGGELAVLYCFIWLYILAAGPGAFSLDGLIARVQHDRDLVPERRRSDRRKGEYDEPLSAPAFASLR